ncbi:hypothetical protein STAS_35700 [Striga asiatica]|uniref:Uncharacterized protein n=1 Tax=Striga asiatica TaxID=4170 RepID=A0A5A7RLM3_STRAF|nr:hypothetical protein STAS_35700 [Striga asiatica]
MRQARKTGLKLRRRKVHPFLQHRPMKPPKLMRITPLSILKVVNRPILKEKPKHPIYIPSTNRVPRLPPHPQNPLHKLSRNLTQILVRPFLPQPLQRVYPSCHRQRVPTQRPRLVNRSSWRHHLHNLSPPSVSPHWQTPANDLPERCQIGGNPKVLLRPTVRDSKSRHHLVEYQKRPVFPTNPLEGVEEVGPRRNEARVPDDGLEDYGRDFALVCSEEGFNGFDVVVRGSEGLVSGGLGDAGGVGEAEGGDSAAGLH